MFRAILFLLVSLSLARAAEDRDAKVRGDRDSVTQGGYWIYNDLPKAFALAKEKNKPLLVVLRCIPCVNCKLFDEQVLSLDLSIKPLLDQFVCARIVQANGLDLSLFQFDYDLSFAAFFLNADRTIYGRFGTRSFEKESPKEISIKGFGKAIEGALELHRNYPVNKEVLAKKTGPAPLVKQPEDFPSLSGKYSDKIDYQGKVAQSCIHCHMTRDAERVYLRQSGKELTEKDLFPWPLPGVIGLEMNPDERATIKQVHNSSIAANAGLLPGDKILTLQGQPLLSTADIQWILHNAPDNGALTALVERNGKKQDLTIELPAGWRRKSDISWRVTTWDLRRMAMGGLNLERLPEEKRQQSGIPEGKMGILVKYAGQYGEHATARNAGARTGDILIAVNNNDSDITESQLLTSILQHTKPGDPVKLKLLRNGSPVDVQFAVR